MHRVLNSRSSFGAVEVRRHGQLGFIRLAHAAGADGVEARGELLTDPRSEPPAMAQAVREAGLEVVYSIPEGLWRADGNFDSAALQVFFAAAASPDLSLGMTVDMGNWHWVAVPLAESASCALWPPGREWPRE